MSGFEGNDNPITLRPVTLFSAFLTKRANCTAFLLEAPRSEKILTCCVGLHRVSLTVSTHCTNEPGVHSFQLYQICHLEKVKVNRQNPIYFPQLNISQVDVSPYSSAYLSPPPPDPSWRR